MIINESYFDELEIENEDIVSDDEILDVEEPKMTIEDFRKLPEQYDYLIKILIGRRNDKETTSFLTSLLPKLFKRLDSIFEMYGIEHSQYVLRSRYYTGDNHTTKLDFGNYQLFCDDCITDIYINDTYKDFYICVYANYPEFTYKRAFRFVYTMLNIFKIDKHFHSIRFAPTEQHNRFMEIGLIYYPFYDTLCLEDHTEIKLYDSSNEIKPEKKRMFYDYVIRHFFGKNKKNAPKNYDVIDRDVPLKPFLNYN